MTGGSQELWRWWEEQDAPHAGDLYPDNGGSGCLALIVALALTFVVWGAVAAIWLLR